MKNVKYNKEILKEVISIFLEKRFLEKSNGGFSFIDKDKALCIADEMLIDYEVIIKAENDGK
jgi:hypothetical protein